MSKFKSFKVRFVSNDVAACDIATSIQVNVPDDSNEILRHSAVLGYIVKQMGDYIIDECLQHLDQRPEDDDGD